MLSVNYSHSNAFYMHFIINDVLTTALFLGGMQNNIQILWHRSKKWSLIKACID